MWHAWLILKVSAKMEMSTRIVDKQDDKVVYNVGFVGIAQKFEKENMALVGKQEGNPGGERIDGDHGENPNDVKLELWLRVMAEMQ